MLREIFALTTGCRDGFRLFPTAQVITSRQRLPVIHYYNTNVRRANTSFPILRIEKYFYVPRARVRSTRNDGREISFQSSFSLMFSLEHRSMQRSLHIGGAEKTREQTEYRATLLSHRYTCRLPACIRLRWSSSFYKKGAPWEGEAGEGRKFRSVGSIKRSTNCSIDISKISPSLPPQGISPTLDIIKREPSRPISNRAGQVREQALSVNQGKWFVKEQARHVKSGMHTQRGARVSSASITELHVCVRVYTVALNYKTNFRPGNRGRGGRGGA